MIEQLVQSGHNPSISQVYVTHPQYPKYYVSSGQGFNTVYLHSSGLWYKQAMPIKTGYYNTYEDAQKAIKKWENTVNPEIRGSEGDMPLPKYKVGQKFRFSDESGTITITDIKMSDESLEYEYWENNEKLICENELFNTKEEAVKAKKNGSYIAAYLINEPHLENIQYPIYSILQQIHPNSPYGDDQKWYIQKETKDRYQYLWSDCKWRVSAFFADPESETAYFSTKIEAEGLLAFVKGLPYEIKNQYICEEGY